MPVAGVHRPPPRHGLHDANIGNAFRQQSGVISHAIGCLENYRWRHHGDEVVRAGESALGQVALTTDLIRTPKGSEGVVPGYFSRAIPKHRFVSTAGSVLLTPLAAPPC